MVRVLGVLLLAAHLTLITRVLLRPLPVAWVYGTNVQPLSTIQRLLLGDPAAGARTIAEGLLVFAPLGVLLPMISGRLQVSTLASFVRTVFLGGSLSFAVECLQTNVRGQVFDVDSLLLNTAGVAIAYLAVVPGARARMRRRRRTRRPESTVARPAVSMRSPAFTAPAPSPYEVAAPRGG